MGNAAVIEDPTQTEHPIRAEKPAPPIRARWELVVPHRERLLRIARRRLPSWEDAEDCVQETLIRAACATGLDEARVGQYVTTILVRLCVDHARSSSAAQRAQARTVHGGWEASPEDVICDRAEATWIMSHVVERLTARERDVLQARVNGLSTRAAAEQLNITGKSAEAALTRARGRIRDTACERTTIDSRNGRPHS
jgi:RNA polymerase sigma factor (sigma-70 family)